MELSERPVGATGVYSHLWSSMGAVACDWVSAGQAESECRQSELSTAEREQALRLKSRTVELLPDGAANLAKLQVGLGMWLGGERQGVAGRGWRAQPV